MTERTKAIVSAIVVLVVEAAGLAGVTLDSDTVTQVASAAVVIVVTIYSIWKNHNFTDAAIQAQGALDALKAEVSDDFREDEDQSGE